MKRIMIDIDDVVTDQTGFLHIVNEFLNSHYTIEDVKGYYIQDLVPTDRKEEFINYFITKDIYEHCHMQPDCIEVIEKLNKQYEVYICSAYVFRDHLLYSADLLKYKFKFLVENFPFLDPNRFTFQTNKTIFDCHIKIDDKMDNLGHADIKLLFDSYHNKNIPSSKLVDNGIIRVYNWKEIADILLK